MAAIIQHAFTTTRSNTIALLFAVGLHLLANHVMAQVSSTSPPSNLHHASVAISPHLQTISPLPILPNTLQLKGDTAGLAWRLDSTLTAIRFYAPQNRYGDTVTITFRTIDIQLHSRFSAKQLLNILSPDSTLIPILTEEPQKNTPPPAPPIVIKGVAERTLGAGSLSNASPSSGMINLSIHGPLYRSTRFETHIVDNSLPFQPDGTSERIENVDKLFLRVFDTAWRIEAGDILIEEQRGNFIRQREETKGIGGAYRGQHKSWDSLAINATLGTAKGEIERTIVSPIDGIQGPYALMGEHDFTQIVVRAGTERVYLDGELLTRGENNDYTIDYNLGSVTFTAKRPINRESRIVVEYETTKRSYTRLLGNVSMAARNRNGWQFDLKGYIAHDRAASLPAELKGAGAIERLSNENASREGVTIVPKGNSVDNRTQGGYVRVDTIVHGQQYSIFRYRSASTNDTLLSLPFTYVGPNQGDYQLTQKSVNGRVFQWVAPDGGTPQGDYAPGIRVAPPASHAMIESTVTKRWATTPAAVSLSAAYTSQSDNTLVQSSKRESYALELSQYARIAEYSNDGLYIHSRGRWVANDFAPINRFLPLEFNRDWGESAPIAKRPWTDAEIALSSRTVNTFAILKGEMLWRPHATAWRGATNLNVNSAHWKYLLTASALIRNADSAQSSRGFVSTTIMRRFQIVSIAGNAKGEWLVATRQNAPIPFAPYAFAEGGITLALSDTLAAKASLRTTYRRTWDSTKQATLRHRNDALEATFEAAVPIGRLGLLNGNATARATLPNQTYEQEQPNLTLLSSISYSQAIARRRLHTNAHLSLSSEQLPKWQFHFIPVAIGQGTHEWIDVNGDGKPQLDEFFPAQHVDRALYVKQIVPSSEQQKAIAATTHMDFTFTPRMDNRPIDSSTLWWQRFDLLLSLEHSAKRTDKRVAKLLNPCSTDPVSSLPERHRTLLLTVALNQNASPLSLTYSLTLSDSRQTIAQGVSTNTAKLHLLTLETPRRKGIGGRLRGEFSNQEQQRPYASQPSESLALWQGEGALLWRGQNNQTHEISTTLGWITLLPKQQKVKSQRYAYKLEIPLSSKWKGFAQLGFCRINGDAIGHHALAYQALRGGTNGNNFNAEATLSYKITSYLDLNCTYAVRKNGQAPLVHSGFATLRAAF